MSDQRKRYDQVCAMVDAYGKLIYKYGEALDYFNLAPPIHVDDLLELIDCMYSENDNVCEHLADLHALTEEVKKLPINEYDVAAVWSIVRAWRCMK